MNYLDIVLCVPLLWGAWRGFRKGFVIEVASLLALGLGIYGGIHFSGMVAARLSGFTYAEGKLLNLISFTVTFIVIVIAVHLLARLLEKIVNLVAMKFINKLAGCLFGFFKIALVLSVLLVITDSIDEQFNLYPQQMKEGSLLHKPVSVLAPMLIPAIRNSSFFSQVENSDSSPNGQ